MAALRHECTPSPLQDQPTYSPTFQFSRKICPLWPGNPLPHLVPHLEPAPHLTAQPRPYWLVWLDEESPWTETLTHMGAETWVESSSHSRRNDL